MSPQLTHLLLLRHLGTGLLPLRRLSPSARAFGTRLLVERGPLPKVLLPVRREPRAANLAPLALHLAAARTEAPQCTTSM